MQVHKKGLRFFFEGTLFGSAFGANRYRQGENHPLTASTSRFGTYLK